ncbi:MAG: hypothetical protein HC836_42250 [Richelia sp. RM2_1_2]|nr:hypothetical protein [Richelia sp. RM2_1_2]
MEVAEKRVISNRATTGSGYFWWECTQLFNSIRSMIKNNIRTNNEFYFAPCYNELIKSGGKVTYFDININDFWELGSPEGVNQFKKIYKNGEFERTDKHR